MPTCIYMCWTCCMYWIAYIQTSSEYKSWSDQPQAQRHYNE